MSASRSAPASSSPGPARSSPAAAPGADARSAGCVDRARHEAAWQGQLLKLTVTEFRLISRLVDRLGEVVDKRDLLAFAWPGVERPDPLWLKPHMARLRSKLIAVGAPLPVPIRGVGYRLDDAVGDETVTTAESVPPLNGEQP